MRDFALSRATAAGASEGFPLLARILQNWRARRALANLDRLDDALLRDIGITRSELHWACGLPLSVNSALALEERAAERRRSR